MYVWTILQFSLDYLHQKLLALVLKRLGFCSLGVMQNLNKYYILFVHWQHLLTCKYCCRFISNDDTLHLMFFTLHIAHKKKVKINNKHFSEHRSTKNGEYWGAFPSITRFYCVIIWFCHNYFTLGAFQKENFSILIAMNRLWG